MRVFHFHSCYPEYFDYFGRRTPAANHCKFDVRLRMLLEDGYNAVHLLQPIYENDERVAVTVANDRILQEQWAAERCLRSKDLTEILLAQIENHRSEVVYSLDPIRWDSAFVKRLPGCVKKTICWRSAPIIGADLSAYQLRVCNFPNFLRTWNTEGLRAEYFSPSVDPFMSQYAGAEDRPIDICFVGSYSKLHLRRNRLLERMAELSNRFSMVFALMHPQHRPLIDLPVLRRIAVQLPYLPKALRKIATTPVFGRDMYALFARSKIVLNAFGEIAGQYRGNMRSFEAMGCGVCMLSEAGIYPPHIEPGVHLETFCDEKEMLRQVERLLSEPQRARETGRRASANLHAHYSKADQWRAFQELVAAI